MLDAGDGVERYAALTSPGSTYLPLPASRCPPLKPKAPYDVESLKPARVNGSPTQNSAGTCSSRKPQIWTEATRRSVANFVAHVWHKRARSETKGAYRAAKDATLKSSRHWLQPMCLLVCCMLL